VSARVRTIVFLLAAAAGGAAFVGGLTGLPDFGHYRGPYGFEIQEQSIPVRHATSAVTPVVFDYRGFDTIGEELILFSAVVGVTILLRHQREERDRPPRDHAQDHTFQRVSEASRVACLALVAPTTVVGLYIVAHGHLTPGGGFQGGGIVAAAGILVYLAGEYLTFRRISPVALLDAGESIGAAGFIVIGLVGLVATGAYLDNVFPLGNSGTVFSAGTLEPINVFVGLEVAVGMLFVVYEFLEQTLVVRRGAR
jgi:multicomponent Na+:H+ antiporter subunit B